MATKNDTGVAQRFAAAQKLRPWHLVAAEYERRTGEHLTRGRVYQIGRDAEQKMRRALARLGVRDVDEVCEERSVG